MRSNRLFLLLIVAALTLLAVPAVADCGAPHGAADATEAKACCSGAAEGKGCGADCPHASKAMKLASAAEKGDAEAMTKLVAMVKESGHGEMATLADKAAGGCEASQASLIAMVKSHAAPGGDAMPAANMRELAKAAGSGCAKSTEMLIANAKKSDNAKMADLAKRAEGGCTHSKDALIAMASETPADGTR